MSALDRQCFRPQRQTDLTLDRMWSRKFDLHLTAGQDRTVDGGLQAAESTGKLCDKQAGRFMVNLFRQSELHQSAFVHDPRPVGQEKRFGLIVGIEA